jgi:hypothetical protein
MPSRLSTADRERLRRADLATIHKLAAQLGMDTADKSLASAYRCMLLARGGATSAAELSPDGRRQVIGHLRLAVGQPAKGGRGMSQHQFIELLWSQLATAGKLDDPTPGGLAKFTHRMTGVHLVRALTTTQANKVIQALKAWASRHADQPGA